MQVNEHGYTAEEVRAAMEALNPPTDYNEWLGLLRSMKHLGVTVEEAEAWSSKAQPYVPGETAEKWPAIGDDNSGGYNLFRVALEDESWNLAEAVDDVELPSEEPRKSSYIGTKLDSVSLSRAFRILGIECRQNFRTKEMEVRRIFPTALAERVLHSISREWGPLTDNGEYRLREAMSERCHVTVTTKSGELSDVPVVFKDVDWRRVLGSFLFDKEVDPIRRVASLWSPRVGWYPTSAVFV